MGQMDLISSTIVLMVLSSGWIAVAVGSGGQELLDLHNIKAVIGKLFLYEIGTEAFRNVYVISQVSLYL